MFYEFIHPYTSHREVFDKYEDAFEYMNAEINANKNKLTSKYFIDKIAIDVNVCKDFILYHYNEDCNIEYVHTTYNCDTNEIMNRVYQCYASDNFITGLKVQNNQVIELYKMSKPENVFLLHSLNIETKEIIEHYKYVDTNLNVVDNINDAVGIGKFNINNEFIVLTKFFNQNLLTEIEKQKLQNCPYKESIIHIKQQTYGFIVHFVEQIHDEISEEELQDWAKQAGFVIKEVH